MRVATVSALLILGALLFSNGVDAVRTKARDLSAAYTFDQYVKEYGKQYIKGSAEYTKRQTAFEASLQAVLKHNSRPGITYKKGINHLSDWHQTELSGLRGVRHPTGDQASYKGVSEKPYVRTSFADPPDEVDYRKAFPAVLTGVKDQGMCGDCWAHAVTEATESAYAVKTGNLFVLSQQQVTSCTPANQSCYACQGSFPRLAYDYIASVGHVVEEWAYSFHSWSGAQPACNATKLNISHGVQVEGYTQIPFNDEASAKAALSENGPLSILVDATSWNQYESGIFTDCDSHSSPVFGLDHAVLLVGYGHDSASGLNYWIVRNSWSAAWGEAGYIRIARTGTNHCSAVPSLSCLGGNTTMQSCGPCGLLTDVQYPNVVVLDRRKL